MVQGHDSAPESEPISPAPSDNDEEEEIVYNTEDFISKAYYSPDSTLPEKFFQMSFAFGFESTKRYNICLADENHVIHWSGAVMHIFNMKTGQTKFRRCNDSGYGHITKHPTLPYIAVGEKGNYPIIIIYQWPDLNVIQVMKRGTKVEYTFLDFSPDGELLASQGGGPDYTLTLWHWAKGWVILRCKAHTQEVYRTEFSRHFPGRLLSSGSGHIKFWTMADTFTGLKLQGKLGKFGKTPISDTTCFYGLSDGLVLSAAENGNMLIWESCQIKTEVIRGKSDPCHQGAIKFFEYDEESGDLFTLGGEGKMRCWEFTSILKGKPKGDRKYVSGLASFEMDIKDLFGVANIQYVIKMSNDPDSDLFYYYIAQDFKGSVWKLDLNLKGNQEPPQRLFLSPKGPIVGMGTSPGDYYVATLDSGGKLLVYNIKSSRLIMARQFPADGSAMIWMPGIMVCILGFTDGTLRLVVLSIRQADSKPQIEKDFGSRYISCIQAIKPHSAGITCFSLREDGEYLASGSLDSTIFIYRVVPYRDYIRLVAVGIMTGSGPAYSLLWKSNVPDHTIIAVCTNGTATEATFEGLIDVKPSENYLYPSEVKQTIFKSVKSEIIRDAAVKTMATRKAEKLAKKKTTLAKMKEDNPGLIIDEAIYFQDSDEEEDLPALYFPAKACTIYFARYIDGRYWLSPSGYDAGFFYLYTLGSDTPSECIPVADAGDIDICSCEDILGGKYMFLGMGNGKIRAVKINPEQPFDFSDYMEITMHEMHGCRISKICFSHDLRYFYSCGTDSNIFSYQISLKEHEYHSWRPLPPLMPIPEYAIDGRIPSDQPSLQEINASAKLRDLEGEAADMMVSKIKELRSMGEKLNELWELNDLLPKERRLNVSDMELHPKFTRFLRQEFEEKLSIWEKKLQFEYEKAKILYKKVYNYYFRPIKYLDVTIKSFKTKGSVKTYRVRQPSNQFMDAEKFLEKFMEKRVPETRTSKELSSSPKMHHEKRRVMDKLPGLDQNLEKYVPLLSPQEKILYDAFKKRRDERTDLLDEIEDGRPELPKETNPENPSNLSKQGRKLKTDPGFRLPFSKRITKQLKLAHIIRTYKEIWQKKEEFNRKIFNLRETKTKEMSKFKQNAALQSKILEYLPSDEALELPPFPPVDLKSEYPEIYYSAENEEEDQTKEDVDVHHPELDSLDPQVIRYYLQTKPRTTDLEEYYAINIYPGIISLKKLQEKMIYETNGFMETFDQKVQKLIWEKMDYGYQLNKMEIYLGTLLQEMAIISKYQFLEETTQGGMRSYLAIKVIYTFKIFVRKRRIMKKENNIEVYNEKIKDIVNEFQNMVASSKFSKHLSRIFKKKYKPPKRDDDEESESESSSSEDESSSEQDEDEGEEMAAYKFDETICPEGCDPYIFNRLFKLRQSRHEYEAKILNNKKDIASNQHEMVGMRRILKIDGVLLAIYQLQLDRISREKQDELNQVNLLLIIDSSQLQNWQVDQKRYVHPNELVVASVKAIRELKESKRQLGITTSLLQSQSKEHGLHRMHLRKDIWRFEGIHKQLLLERKEALIQKFGIETNVYTLDVEATRRLLLSKAYDVVLDERFGLLKQLKQRMYDEKEKLAALKKMHANNLFTLAAIESEKYKSIKNEQKLKKKHLHEYISEDQLDSDLQNLEFIICQQRALKEKLKNEIRYLKIKDQGLVAKKVSKEVMPEKRSEKSLVAMSGLEFPTGPAEYIVETVPAESEEEILPIVEEFEESEKEIAVPFEEVAYQPDQEELKFEDIFARILKQVIPSDIIIVDVEEKEMPEEDKLSLRSYVSEESIPLEEDKKVEEEEEKVEIISIDEEAKEESDKEVPEELATKEDETSLASEQSNEEEVDRKVSGDIEEIASSSLVEQTEEEKMIRQSGQDEEKIEEIVSLLEDELSTISPQSREDEISRTSVLSKADEISMISAQSKEDEISTEIQYKQPEDEKTSIASDRQEETKSDSGSENQEE